MCGILHVKTSYVKSVSTWRLVSCESCRYILSYTTLVGPRHRSERSRYLTKQKHLIITGFNFLGYLKVIHFFIQDWVYLDLCYEFLPFSKKT